MIAKQIHADEREAKVGRYRFRGPMAAMMGFRWFFRPFSRRVQLAILSSSKAQFPGFFCHIPRFSLRQLDNSQRHGFRHISPANLRKWPGWGSLVKFTASGYVPCFFTSRNKGIFKENESLSRGPVLQSIRQKIFTGYSTHQYLGEEFHHKHLGISLTSRHKPQHILGSGWPGQDTRSRSASSQKPQRGKCDQIEMAYIYIYWEF